MEFNRRRPTSIEENHKEIDEKHFFFIENVFK